MEDKNKFNCNLCKKTFATNWGLDRHLREGHGQEVGKRRNITKYKCPHCGNILRDYEEYRDHVLKTHDISIEIHFFKFQSQSCFAAWKRKVEKETKSSYVKETKICSNTNKLVLEETKPCVSKKVGVVRYRCHRSGYSKHLKDESERKRRVKAQGTAKINAYCPAKITAEFKRKGSVKVVYCPTHVGHECEISYLRLTEEERREIVSKIAANVPFDVILDEIRNTAGGSNISRKHLLSRRDLWTISHSSYYKKYRESLKSLLPSETGESNVEFTSNNLSDQDSFINVQSGDAEEYEEAEIQTFNPNDPDSDSDMSSDCAELKNNQSHKPLNVNSHSSVIGYNQMKTKNKTTSCQGRLIDSCSKLDGLTVSQKRSQLVEKFRTNANSLTSSQEIKWVENHINRIFILLKSMKERSGVVKKDIKQKGKVAKTLNSIPNKHSPKLKPSNRIHQASRGVKTQLFLPGTSPQSSKAKLDFQSRLVKYAPVLESCKQKSAFQSIKPSSCDSNKTNIKPVSDLKTQSSSSAQFKQYLVPIAGKPDKFLIVQTKQNEPPPVGPLTPVTSNQKSPNNRNAVFIDHSYSAIN